MTATSRNLLLLALLTVAACATQSGDSDGRPPEPERAEIPVGGKMLRLVAQPEGEADERVVELQYDDGRVGAARVGEIFVEHAASVELVRAEPGEALRQSDKTLVAQQKDGAVRLIVYSSSNTHPIAPGTLATLRFRLKRDGDTTLRIREGAPVFAPAEANQGVAIGPPIRL